MYTMQRFPYELVGDESEVVVYIFFFFKLSSQLRVDNREALLVKQKSIKDTLLYPKSQFWSTS